MIYDDEEDDVKVGPDRQFCSKCLGDNDDGYGPIVHYEDCPDAPKGKARKAQPVRLRKPKADPTPEQRAADG